MMPEFVTTTLPLPGVPVGSTFRLTGGTRYLLVSDYPTDDSVMGEIHASVVAGNTKWFQPDAN